MVHFRQPSAHVNKTDYMNLPCDASSSPLSSSIWALSCTRRTIDWHSLEEEPVCSSPRALGQNKSCLTTTILCGSSRMDQKKKNRIKSFCFGRNSHLGVPVCRRVKRVRSARCGLCSSSQCHSAHYFKSREYDFKRLGTAL